MRRSEAGLESPGNRQRGASTAPERMTGDTDPDAGTIRRGWRPCGAMHHDATAEGANLKGPPGSASVFPPVPAVTFPMGISKSGTHDNAAFSRPLDPRWIGKEKCAFRCERLTDLGDGSGSVRWTAGGFEALQPDHGGGD